MDAHNQSIGNIRDRAGKSHSLFQKLNNAIEQFREKIRNEAGQSSTSSSRGTAIRVVRHIQHRPATGREKASISFAERIHKEREALQNVPTSPITARGESREPYSSRFRPASARGRSSSVVSRTQPYMQRAWNNSTKTDISL